MEYCPECNGSMVKAGSNEGKPRFKCTACGKKTANPKRFEVNKKQGDFNWREWSKHLKNKQQLHEEASLSQDSCKIKIDTKSDYIIYQPLSDMHIGSICTNYNHIENFTDSILKYDNLYFSQHGDMVDGFYNFKNMLAVHQMQLSPDEQRSFLESWLTDVQHKFLFATWGNHEEMEERVSGMNSTKALLSKKVVYFNGIGIANLELNGIDYKIATTHKTRFNSSFNKTHGLKQLARKDIPDADIYIAGHTHDPSFEFAFERGQWQLFVILGSMKSMDGYAKRYFTYWLSNQMTAIVLGTKTKSVTPFLCLQDAIKFANSDVK